MSAEPAPVGRLVDHFEAVSTNGSRITTERARWLASRDYVDVQISIDGATAEVNDRVRGTGSYAVALQAMDNLVLSSGGDGGEQ